MLPEKRLKAPFEIEIANPSLLKAFFQTLSGIPGFASYLVRGRVTQTSARDKLEFMGRESSSSPGSTWINSGSMDSGRIPPSARKQVPNPEGSENCDSSISKAHACSELSRSAIAVRGRERTS